MSNRRFVLVDRDGTIIVERGYLSDPAQVELLPGAAVGLRKMRELGLGLVVVTNQSGIGRGFFDRATLDLVHRRMSELLAAEGVQLDAIYHCPHTPQDNCACRKPRAGLIQQAAIDFGFVPAEGFVVGDKPCDVELGQGVGATTFLVRTGYGAEHEAAASCTADFIVDDLEHAAERMARNLRGHSGATTS